MVSAQFRKNFKGPSIFGGWVEKLQTFTRRLFSQRLSTNYIAEFTEQLYWSKWYSIKWSTDFDSSYFQQYLTPIPQFLKYDQALPKYLAH